MNNIDEIINNLSHHMPADVQQKARCELISIDDGDLIKLVQPLSKDHWENAAMVIKDIGYPRIRVILPQLLEWLQDMN